MTEFITTAEGWKSYSSEPLREKKSNALKKFSGDLKRFAFSNLGPEEIREGKHPVIRSNSKSTENTSHLSERGNYYQRTGI